MLVDRMRALLAGLAVLAFVVGSGCGSSRATNEGGGGVGAPAGGATGGGEGGGESPGEARLPEIAIGPVSFEGGLIRQALCPTEPGDPARPVDLVQGLTTDLNEVQTDVDLTPYVGHVSSIGMGVTYAIGLNTLNKDLAPIDIWFGPKEVAEDPSDIRLEAGATLYGSTHSIRAGFDTGGEQRDVAWIDMEGLGASLRLFKTNFAFSTLFAIPPTLAPEDCRTLEGTLEISAHLFLVYNPWR